MKELFLSKRHCAIILLAILTIGLCYFPYFAFSQNQQILPVHEYEDRVHAIWSAQMIGALMGFQFEHKVSSVKKVEHFELRDNCIPVDDDWYYEMVAIRAFEKYGIDMSVEELGKQWIENSAGSWGSSEQSLSLLKRGIPAELCGHPRYNKLWFTIGPQFSSDVYGALAPGMPQVASKLARKYGHINGYAEAVDGGVFIAGMISLAFFEKNSQAIVKKASGLIHSSSPYKQCLNMVIELAEKGKSFREIVNVVEDRWHLEYPATNNAVANGGIVAACVWFGSGDFLKTVNLAFEAADFSDADCNAANAAAVIGAMHGLKGIPENLICVLGDIIKGEKMGGVKLTPVVNESLLAISKRTVDIGKRMLMQHGTNLKNHNLIIPIEPLKSLPSEIFTLSDLMDYWNPDWQLERAGFGGAGGGMRGIRGITYLNDTILATYPRDEVRGLFLKREITIQEEKELFIEVGVDKNRCWELNIYIDNEHVLRKLIEGKDMERTWFSHKVDLAHYQGKAVTIRMFQKVLLPGKEAGNAYWKTIRIF